MRSMAVRGPDVVFFSSLSCIGLSREDWAALCFPCFRAGAGIMRYANLVRRADLLTCSWTGAHYFNQCRPTALETVVFLTALRTLPN